MEKPFTFRCDHDKYTQWQAQVCGYMVLFLEAVIIFMGSLYVILSFVSHRPSVIPPKEYNRIGWYV